MRKAIAVIVAVIVACLMPRTDIGKFVITVETPEGTSLRETERVVSRLEQVVMREPEVERIVSVVGQVKEARWTLWLLGSASPPRAGREFSNWSETHQG